jgi:M6 family metalloprotease-like protein
VIEKTPRKLFYSKEQVNTLKQIRKMTEDIEPQDESGTNRVSPQKATTPEITPVLGEKRVLCILAQFSDKTFIHNAADFQALMNQVGYTANGNQGSVKDFYRENSYGKMDITVTVAGPVTVPNTSDYYSSVDDDDDRWRDFAKDAAIAADNIVDFSQFAENNYVQSFHIIFAGFGAENSGISEDECIWSHQWSFKNYETLDGVSVGKRYSCSPELRGSSGTNMTYIGVICHELCHTFGAPDYYDVDYEDNGQYAGTGVWDLMADGSWNGDGACPAHINGWQKILFGWITPVELTGAVTVTDMPAACDSAKAYWISANSNGERYILENRQKKKFDSHIPGHGLLIYHIHKNALSGDCDNSTHPQEVYPVCASATTAIPTKTSSSYGAKEDSYGDYTVWDGSCLFPGTSNKKSFSGSTTPCMFTWQGNAAVKGKPITNITENAGKISFDFMGSDSSNSGDSQVGDGSYTLVTSASDLVAGAKYVIAGRKGDNIYGLGYQKSNNRDGVLIAESSTIPESFVAEAAASTSDETHIYNIVLGGVSGNYTLTDEVAGKYIGPIKSEDKNQLITTTDETRWTVSISNKGVATITCIAFKNNDSRNTVRFNNGNTLFACYKTGQSDVYLYRLNTSTVDTPNMARVVISPDGGIYSDTQNVTMSCSVEGAQIRYTLDGSIPTAASTLYSSAVKIGETKTVKALAFKDGYRTVADSVSATVYTIVPPSPNSPALTLLTPTEGQAFTSGDINITWTKTNFVAGADGKFKVSVTGCTPVFVTDTFHTVGGLLSGSYSVVVELVDMNESLIQPRVIQTRTFTVDLLDAATPVFKPAAGIYYDSVVVTVVCATENATILISNDGSDYEIYSAPLVLHSTAMLSAKAFKAGMDTGSIATAFYTIAPSPYFPPTVDSSYEYIETFDNMTLAKSGTYGNSHFVGNYGIRWDYIAAREASGYTNGSDGDYIINGKGLILRRGSDNSKIVSSPIEGGIGKFYVQFRKAYTGSKKRHLELYVNGDLKGISDEIGDASGTDATIYEFVVDNINISGQIEIKISVSGNAQVTIDNIAWTAYSDITVSAEQAEEMLPQQSGVAVYPNPASGEITVSVNEPSLVEIFTLGGTHIANRQVACGATKFLLQNKGIYMLRATAASGKISAQKVIVK